MLLRFIRGRLKCKFYVLVIFILIFIVCAYFYQQLGFFPIAPITIAPNLANTRVSRHLTKLITVVFRQFDDIDNDIIGSVQSVLSVFPNMPILVICDGLPYPPFSFSATNVTLRNVRVISLDLNLNASPEDLNPLSYVKTDYVLLVPDGTRIPRRVLQNATISAMSSTNAIAIGVGGSQLTCQNVKWHQTDWTVVYTKGSGTLCDAVHGSHALLLRTSILRTLPHPFIMPVPEALYIQTSVRNIIVQIFHGKFGVGRELQKTNWGAKQHSAKRLKENRAAFFKQTGIKAVIRADQKVHWFGCKRDGQRCFPPVQGTPSYILAGRNMPPCCRQHLRRTVDHVLQALQSSGVRCWLETTSLLGAVVREDVLPYAEYAEVGVHAADVARVRWLSRGGPDAAGYVWERATRGRYYRVAFSPTNRMYVLLLPFVARNGTMWPDDWVLSHQREFPERHLHPLAQIKFVGKLAPAPNDARAFLDLKLGVNSVERSSELGAKLLYP